MQFINNQWLEGKGPEFHSTNPSTGDVIWSGKSADSVQVAAAVTAAQKAFPAWSATPYEKRVEIVTAFRTLIEAEQNTLAELISQETGKVLWDAKTEAAAVLGKLNFSLKAYEERTASKRSEMAPKTQAVLRHRPHGVMAVYGPYNFPAHLPNGHIMPALLAGNAIVFKPSELTPTVAEWYVKKWEEAGLPAGVLNMVQGERDTGIALAKAPINGLLFTGSSATGALLHQQFAGRPEVMLALEMGGNNPLVVHDIQNIKAAVHETLLSAYMSTGQRCTCARRLIVTDGPWQQPFLEALAEATKNLKVGSYNETPAPYMGPMVSAREATKLLEAQDTLLKAGATSLAPMRRLHETLPFISAGLLDVTAVRNRPDEEWFGPLLQVIRVQSWDDAISEANATRFGLSAGLLCDDPQIFEDFVQRVHAGIVNFNRQTTGASGMAPFGGIGCSGNHRPAGYYSADYCAFPVASVEVEALALPEKLPEGMVL